MQNYENYHVAVPVPVFVGTLMGVIAVLILLTVIIAVLCIKRGRRKEDAADHDGDTTAEYDDVIEKVTECSRATTGNPIEMKVNEAYGTHQQQNDTMMLETSVEAYYEELH